MNESRGGKTTKLLVPEARQGKDGEGHHRGGLIAGLMFAAAMTTLSTVGVLRMHDGGLGHEQEPGKPCEPLRVEKGDVLSATGQDSFQNVLIEQAGEWCLEPGRYKLIPEHEVRDEDLVDARGTDGSRVDQ
jgi:hypothetical protein